NFHVFAHGQYHHSFYFFALFDYEIACLLVQLISLFAFYKLHNSYVNRSFLGGTNVRHFRSFRQPLPSKVYTLYFIFIKCVLCEAVGSADQNHKTFKTFLFFTRKKKQKNLPSATSAKGGFALVLV